LFSLFNADESILNIFKFEKSLWSGISWFKYFIGKKSTFEDNIAKEASI